VTSFFVPGADASGTDAESLYADFLQAAEDDTGCPPVAQRIFKLAYRHEGVDVEVEVGKPGPSDGQTVVAILDLGRRLPYLIRSDSPGGTVTEVLVEKPVYDVTEFRK
jgi:hypothetical protein